VIHFVPGDPAEQLLSQGGVAPDPTAVAELREKLGLDRPMLAQYVSHVGGLLKGDLGSSLLDDHSVAEEIALRLPRTLELIFAASLIAVLFGLPLGTLAALRSGGAIDRVLAGAAGLGLSIPVFVVGTVAILVFAQKLRWVPAGGFVPFARDPLQHLILLLMPADTIALGLGAVVFRVTRSSVLEVLERDYVRAAHAKGLKPSRIVLHQLRNVDSSGHGSCPSHGSRSAGRCWSSSCSTGQASPAIWCAVEQRDYPEVVGIVLAFPSLSSSSTGGRSAVCGDRPARAARLMAARPIHRLSLPGAIVAVIVGVAPAAPLLPLTDPVKMEVPARLPASPSHVLGQDEYGRDVLSRIIWGARASLAVAFFGDIRRLDRDGPWLDRRLCPRFSRDPDRAVDGGHSLLSADPPGHAGRHIDGAGRRNAGDRAHDSLCARLRPRRFRRHAGHPWPRLRDRAAGARGKAGAHSRPHHPAQHRAAAAGAIFADRCGRHGAGERPSFLALVSYLPRPPGGK
jgi:peptide/nickel transport system permease protein